MSTILKYISLEGLIWMIVVLPLAASAINWLLSAVSVTAKTARVRPFVSAVGTILPAMAFFSALAVFWVLTGLEGSEPVAITGPLYQLFGFAGWVVDIGLKADQLSMVMALIVTGVGTLIHIYSIGYMEGEEGYPRYFAEMNLFLFFMLLLVLADNLLLMFVGWEGVGLCSYLLIGFWFGDEERARAATKAFIVNRIGDFGFLIAVFLIWKTLEGQELAGSYVFNFETLKRDAAFFLPIATPLCLALFAGAIGKSAQIPLHVWLPDAMAGPTPVSALIHAATMVTAGIYMVARLNFLFILSPDAMQVVAYIGAATAVFGAAIGLTQRDIKKVLAYSTISQLGFMFMAVGMGAFSAGMFHLVTHAFFKAALFLGAGIVIHALHGEQDIFKMGGLKKKLPGTCAAFFVAAVAMCGVYPFAGFFSKDEILWEAFNRGFIGLWLIGFAVAGLTAFYTFRAVALVFFGATRLPEDKFSKVEESRISMLIPLVLLGVLSAVGGFIGSGLLDFLQPIFVTPIFEEAAGHSSIKSILSVVTVLWVAHWAFVAWIVYVQRPSWPVRVAERFKRTFALLSNKFYLDEIYDFLIVRPFIWFNSNVLYRGVDASIIDDVAVEGSARGTGLIGSLLPRLQTGFAPHYLFFMGVGLAAIIGWIVL